MGGGGDTVVDGGLSDDQYQDLADNQVGISGQITDESAEANKRFDTFAVSYTHLTLPTTPYV